MGDLLTVGTVARMAGVSADTIRYYERLRLLPRPARTLAGYRQYPPQIVNRLTLIRNAQQFGFSLAEIGAFLRVREAGGRPCHDVRAAAARMLQAVDRQIADLTEVRARMRDTLAAWDDTLARTPASQPARLLERLSQPDRAGTGRTRMLRRPRGRSTPLSHDRGFD